MDDPEIFWGQILSRDAEQVRAAWNDLQADEREAVYAHLVHMVSEEGWAEQQRFSAQAALDALGTDGDFSSDQS